MEGYFNYNSLLTYYNTKNYQGAIDYINSFNYEGEDAITMRNELNKLERAKSIEENTKKRLVGEDSEAYNFMQGLNTNYIDRSRKGNYADGTAFNTSNRYGDEYLKHINNIKTKDGKTIDTIIIDIDDQNALTRLQNKLKEDNVSIEDLGGKIVGISGGKYRLNIPKDNTNLYRFINSISQLNTLDSMNAMGSGALIGGSVGAIAGLFTSLGIGSATLGAAGAVGGAGVGGAIANWVNDYEIKGVLNGKLYDSSDFNVSSLRDAVSVVNKANDKYKDINERLFNYDNSPSELSISGYISAGHAQAAKLLSEGKITPTQFNICTDAWKDWLINTIYGAGFADKKVYAFGNNDDDYNDDGTINRGVMLNRITNTDAENVKTEILAAIKDNRCKYMMATKDGQIGTYFEISHTINEKGKNINEFAKRPLKVFVEGLYHGSAEEYYESDSKTSAARTNADMKKIGYSKTLNNDIIVGYENGIPYEKTYNPYTQEMENIPISEEKMLSYLNTDINVNNSINFILKHYDKLNNIVAVYDGKEYKNFTLEDMISKLTNDITDESYPANSYNKYDRIVEQSNIYYSILQGVRKYIKDYNTQN